MIICVRYKYLKPYNNALLFVLDRNTWYHITMSKQLLSNKKYEYKCTINTIP